MPASGISSELRAHQMAPAGVIAHSRAHLCPRASSLSSSTLVSPLRPLGFGLLGRCDLGFFLSFSTTLRTMVQPAIEFVSGMEGLRPRIAVFVSSYCILRVQVFLEFGYWDTLKFASAPGLSGGRGEMAMAVASSARLAFLRGAVCACCTPYTRRFPLVPVQRWSIELPATTVGERRRRRSLRRHKGGPWTVPLTFKPPRFVAGWFLSVRRLAPGWAESQVPQTQ